jgi:hypothetical protein
MRIFLQIALLAVGMMVGLPASAQETVVLAIEGWQQNEGRDGVVYYRCASSICADGSVVSYKAQPHRPTVTLAQFETFHRGLAQQNAGTGKIKAVRITDPKERTIDGVRVLQVSREVDWTDTTTTFTIQAQLIGSDRSFSLVSDSPGREWTANNFAGFLRRMVDIAGIKGQ